MQSILERMKMAHLKRLTLLVFVTLGIIGCRKPQSLQYVDFKNFKVDNFGLKSSVISADLFFYNPNKFRLKLNKAEMDLTVNNKFLGHSTLDTLMQIPRRDTFFLPVHFTVDMKALLANSLSTLLSNEINIKMEGNARLGKGGFYFNFPFMYEGKQRFDLFR